jgi:hypothetical protein
MYKIYRSNNYFVIIDPKGTYFEEQCENVFVTKRKEGDQTYTISFLRQETLRGGTALSQSFPGINFSDIVDEFGAPYASVAAWEDFYTTNTGIGYLLASLAATGLATEATLLDVLAAVDAMRDYEVRLVVDSDVPPVTWLEVRYWDTQSGTLGTPEYYLPGSTVSGMPTGSISYINPNTFLAQLVTNTTGLNLEVTQQLIKTVLDNIKLDTANLDVALSTRATEATLELVRLLLVSLDGKDFATQTTLDALLTAFNAEDFATQTTLAAQAADIATIEANIALLNSKFNVFGREPEATSTPVAIDLEAYNALLAIQTAVQNIDSDLGVGGLALDTTVQATNTLLTTIDGVLDTIKVDTAAMVVDLAAIEVLITTTNSLLTTIDGVIDQIQTNTLNTVNELTSANVTLASILADTTTLANNITLLATEATSLLIKSVLDAIKVDTAAMVVDLAAIEVLLTNIDGNVSSILTAVSNINAAVGTDGTAHGASQKGVRALGTDGTNDQQIATDADGKVKVILDSPAAVPVTDNGSSLTVDNAIHDNFNANANLQVGDVDVSGANPVPVSLPAGVAQGMYRSRLTNTTTIVTAGATSMAFINVSDVAATFTDAGSNVTTIEPGEEFAFEAAENNTLGSVTVVTPLNCTVVWVAVY